MNFSPKHLLIALAIIEIATVIAFAAQFTTIPKSKIQNPTSEIPCPLPFADLRGNNFTAAIHTLYCRGLISGVDPQHYRPAATATRAQFAREVVLALVLPAVAPAQPHFSDVHPAYFAYTYIESGYAASILRGFDHSTCTANHLPSPCYRPNLPITRAQLTSLVVAAAHYSPLVPANPSFTDVPESSVFYTAIETANAHHLISGYPDHRFHPNNNIRRDEMAQVIAQTLTKP